MMSIAGFGTCIIYTTTSGLVLLGDADNYICGTWGIALLGLLECVVLGWMGKIKKLKMHANSKSRWQAEKLWTLLIRVVIPASLAALFFWNLYGNITSKNGFLVNSKTGGWIWPNVIGTSIFLVIVPIIAIVIRLIKSRSKNHHQPIARGRIVSAVSLMFAIIALVVLAVVFVNLIETSITVFWQVWLTAALMLCIAAVAGANAMLEKYDVQGSRPSWKAKWAGLFGSVGIGAFLAIELINYTVYHKVQESASPDNICSVHLNGAYYAILGFVILVILSGLVWCFINADSTTEK